MLITEISKKQVKSASLEKRDELIKKLKKEHEKMVKGKFEFVDAQGGWLEFNYRWFKDDVILRLKIMHGEIVELPMGIIKHLNNTRKKIRKLVPNMSGDERNAKQGYVMETQSRVAFTPVELL